jgi:hypothetical protein
MAKSKLCRFAPRDYIALSSAVSLAIADELDAEELTVLVAFFAVVAEQLNLIATAKGLCTPDNSDSSVTDVNEPTDPLSPDAEAEIAVDKSSRKKTKKKKPKAPTQ